MGDAEQQVQVSDDDLEGDALEVVDMDGEEQPAEEQNQPEGEAKEEPAAKKEEPEAEVPGIPSPRTRAPKWATVPKGLKVPRGTTPFFLRFRAEWTATPHKGERQAVIWPLTLGEQFAAIERAKVHETQTRLGYEFAKQMIRSVDGHLVDWSGKPGPGSIDVFWREIGPKCRKLLSDLFLQLHHLDRKELIDFFENCVVPVSTG